MTVLSSQSYPVETPVVDSSATDNELWATVIPWVDRRIKTIHAFLFRRGLSLARLETSHLAYLVGFDTLRHLQSRDAFPRIDLFEQFFFRRLSAVANSYRPCGDPLDVNYKGVDWIDWIQSTIEPGALFRFINASCMTKCQKKAWRRYLFTERALSHGEWRTIARSLSRVDHE